MFLLLLWRWQAIEPSNARDWQPESAVLSHASIDGERVTVHNVRNFDYRTETDFTPAYYDKTFDLRQLDSVDLVAVYWMGPAIAHVFLSFGFGGDHLAISIEARKERGEGYSTLRGFFRQYELIYVVADERDVIRLRTNYRKDPPEAVHVYRLLGPAENLRRLFLEYMREINALAQRARVLQLADDQLHEQHLAAHARQPRPPAVLMEAAGQRLRPRVPLRGRQARHPRALRRAAAAQPRQRARAGRGQGRGLLAAHPDDRPSPSLMRGVTAWLPLGPIAKPVAKPKLADSTRAWCPRGDRTCNAICNSRSAPPC